MTSQRFQPDRCKKCGGRMHQGIAMTSTVAEGIPDFSGDRHASTLYEGGPGRLIAVRKCERCGWSIHLTAAPITPSSASSAESA